MKYNEGTSTYNIEPLMNTKAGIYKISIVLADSLGA